jgi:hypothetical protein
VTAQNASRNGSVALTFRDFNVCIPQRCSFVGPCATGDSCGGGIFTGTCTVVGYCSDYLCC